MSTMFEPAWLNVPFLFFLGLLLLGMELFVPSFGLLTVAAVVSFAFALSSAFAVHAALGWSLVALLGVLAAFSPRIVMAVWRRTDVVLEGPQVPMGDDPMDHAVRDLWGKTGITLTALRPAGRIEIEGQAYDVRAEHTCVPVGARVQVHDVEHGRITVVPI